MVHELFQLKNLMSPLSVRCGLQFFGGRAAGGYVWTRGRHKCVSCISNDLVGDKVGSELLMFLHLVAFDSSSGLWSWHCLGLVQVVLNH